MEMADGLPSARSYVDHDSITVAEPLRDRQLVGNTVQVAQQLLLLIRCSNLCQRSNVFSRKNQRMDRRLRVRIGKGYGLVIFIELVYRNFSGGDFAEDAIHLVILTRARRTTVVSRGNSSDMS